MDARPSGTRVVPIAPAKGCNLLCQFSLCNLIAQAFALLILLGCQMGYCDNHVSYDWIFPIDARERMGEPLSEQVRYEAGKQSACYVSVNDANPGSTWDLHFTSPVSAGLYFVSSMEPLIKGRPLHFVHWNEHPPSCTPFDITTGVVCVILCIFHLGRKLRSSYLLWMVSTGVALPIAAHLSDRRVTSRFIQCHLASIPRTPQFTGRRRVGLGTYLGAILFTCVAFISVSILVQMTPWDPGITPSALPNTIHSLTHLWSHLRATRVGEASNPGPEVSIATLNVAYLCGNQDEVARQYSLPTACLFTETCLTKHILPTISRKARVASKFVVPGCLCAPRKSAHKSDSISRGESGGVLLNSDLPARAGGIPLDDLAWASTRVVESIVHIGPNFVVRLVGIYGFSKRYPSHIEATNTLLYRTLEYLSRSDIPCVFLGDFNCELHEVSVWHYLRDRGWRDSAILQQDRDGSAPTPTWKSYSRIDFILLPPTLVPFFKAYTNDPDTISDHSRISVSLSTPDIAPQRRNWRPCRDSRSILETSGWQPPFYEDIEWTSFVSCVSTKNVQGAYKLFCQNYEQALTKAHTSLDVHVSARQFQGRACPKIVSQLLHPPLVKPSRHNELDFHVDDAPNALRQRIRQARRVITLKGQMRWLLSSDADRAERAIMAARNTWESILESSGFQGGFRNFSHHALGIPLPPVLFPDHVNLVHLLDSALQSHIQKWRWEYAKLKQHRYNNYMEADWKKGGKTHFASIRPSPKPEIALLEIPFPMDVIRHRHEKQGPFVLTCLADIPEGVTSLQFGDTRRSIVKRDPPFIHLDAPLSATCARVQVVLMKPTGSLSDIHSMAIQYWDRYWNSPHQAEPEKLEQVLADFPVVPPFDPSIQLEEVVSALKKICVDKARGPDSWSPWELKNLPHPFVVALTSLFNLFVEQTEWPTALTQATL